MKYKFVLVILLGLLTNIAVANQRPTTKKQCLKNCSEVMHPEKKKALDEQLLALRQQKEQETDLRKIKKLEEQEQALIDRHEDYIEAICVPICADNPAS